MKFKLAALLLALACTARAAPPTTLADFYPVADRASREKHDLAKWSVACTRPDGKRGFVSLLADEGGRVVMAAYSENEPVNVPRLFDPRRNGATRDWAWVFDRAGRGRIDYFAFHMGDQPVKPGNFREDFPKGRGLSRKEDVDYLFANVRTVFYHGADDNGDGRVDTTVYPVVDPERPAWIEGFAVLQSSRFNDVIDTDWLFLDDIRVRRGPVPRNAKGLRVRLDPEDGMPPDRILPAWSDMLADFNRTVDQCGLGARLSRP